MTDEKTPSERLRIIKRLAAEGAITREYLVDLVKQFKHAELRAAVVDLLTEKNDAETTAG